MRMPVSILLVLTLILLPLASCKGAGGKFDKPVEAGIMVGKIEGLSRDFIMGADVSSLISLERSGVRYYNFKGKEQDLLLTLKDAGVNYIRVRVWLDPFDSKGNGYGGGNCDIKTAAELGARAAKYGLKLLVDFHYSDFWADPSKQQSPKAWEGLEFEDKQAAIAMYTSECLRILADGGADIGMVQLGNETTTGLAGEKYWLKITGLMSSAAEAVRGFDHKILIAVHFTNPESGQYSNYAFQMKNFGVDYDVFASSYYPYWHGTLENLTGEMEKIADKYGKKVMIAETSYAYALEEGDSQPNTIGATATYEKPYPFTVQGQATAVAAVIEAMAGLGDKALGVFYWEPAWLPVPADTFEEERQLWERDGSGWATSYAAEYDPKDAGVYYGGSACDNQAMFDMKGYPLESLKVFSYVYSGTITERLGHSGRFYAHPEK